MSDEIASRAGLEAVGSRPGGAPSSMPERTLSLFGVDICDTDLDAAAVWLVRRATHRLTTSVAFLNAHSVNVMHRDTAYRAALGAMSRVYADGIGVRIAARLTGETLRDNVNGTDLFPVLCHHAADAGTGLFLLGAAPGIADAAGSAMIERTPGLRIAGTMHGYLAGPDEERAAIERINASGAGIVLVGMGVPAQELWIERNRARIAAPVVIGVGGLFDYYSGRIPRAPLRLRRMGLEWAWRLAQEPRRLARRYLLGNVEFLARLFWARLVSPAALGRPSAGV